MYVKQFVPFHLNYICYYFIWNAANGSRKHEAQTGTRMRSRWSGCDREDWWILALRR